MLRIVATALLSLLLLPGHSLRAAEPEGLMKIGLIINIDERSSLIVAATTGFDCPRWKVPVGRV